MGVPDAEQQRSVSPHAEADDVRRTGAGMIDHCRDIIGRVDMTVSRGFRRYVRGRIAASIECNASVLARKPAKLCLPFAGVRAEFMNEYDGVALTDLLIMQADGARLRVSHQFLRCAFIAFNVAVF